MKIGGRVVATGICIILLLSSLGMMSSDGQTYPYDTYILRVAVQDDVKSFNPLVAGDVWSWDVVGYIYDKPIKIDPETGEVIPYIAVGSANLSTSQDVIDWDDLTIGNFGYSPKETWANSSKQEAIIFYDFTGVRWHDGTQMSIRDVLFSYHVQAQFPVWNSDVRPVMDMGGETGSNFPDTHSLNIYPVYESQDGLRAALRYDLQVPFADFMESTLSIFLLPYHIWGTTASGQPHDDMMIWLDDGYSPDDEKAWDRDIAVSWDNPVPVGSGAFKFNSWNKGVSSRMDTYREHFYTYGWNPIYDPKGNAHQPFIDGVVFKLYRTAEQTILALRSDNVDYIRWSIPPTFVQGLMNDPDIGIKQSAEKGFFYLGYNMRPERRSFGYNETGVDVGKPLRRAIAHCIDKQTIVQRLLQNFGIPGDVPVSSISPWYNESLPKYPFDPEHAKVILRDAGYKLTDGSIDPATGLADISKAGPGNWWLNPDGSPIGNGDGGKIEILNPPADYDPIRAQAGLMIAKQMQDIGLNAGSIVMNFGTIVSYLDQRNFDMYIMGWRIGSDPVDYLYSFFHSSNINGGLNYIGYRNITFDDLLEQARETNDDDVRSKAIMDAQAAIAYDLPYDVLYFKTNIEAFRSDRFTGWVQNDIGTIYNWRSLYDIRPPSNTYINARFINTPLSMYSDGEIVVEVLVTSVTRNPDGTLTRAPLEGVWVEFSVSNGTLDRYNGTSDASGKVRLKFTAPYVDSDNPLADEGLGAFIEISTAKRLYYDDARPRVHLVTIFNQITPFLNLEMEIDPDVIEDVDTGGQAGITYITVTAKDENNMPVEGVEISFETIPDGPEVDLMDNATDNLGELRARFSADMGLDEDEIVVVVARAARQGYQNGSQSIWLDVLEQTEIIGDPTPPKSYLIESLVVVGIIGIVAVVAVVVYWGRKAR